MLLDLKTYYKKLILTKILRNKKSIIWDYNKVNQRTKLNLIYFYCKYFHIIKSILNMINVVVKIILIQNFYTLSLFKRK